MSRHPSVKWAQRSDVLFLTIELPDAKDVKLKLEPDGKFYFSATSGPEKLLYEIDIDLYDKVDVNESKSSVGSRNIIYLIKKVESKWWSRLLKNEGKPPVFLKVDWDKWVDEDEQDEQAVGDLDYDNINFSNLKLAGGEDTEYDPIDDEGDDDSDTEEEIKEAKGDDDSDTEEDIKEEGKPISSQTESKDEEKPAKIEAESKEEQSSAKQQA